MQRWWLLPLTRQCIVLAGQLPELCTDWGKDQQGADHFASKSSLLSYQKPVQPAF